MEFLLLVCCDWYIEDNLFLGFVEIVVIFVVMMFKRVIIEDVKDVIDKVVLYLMKRSVGEDFIFNVCKVLDILYGCFDEEEFLKERS